ncbi:Cell division topological specificity factor [Bienertia sinuspersici]
MENKEEEEQQIVIFLKLKASVIFAFSNHHQHSISTSHLHLCHYSNPPLLLSVCHCHQATKLLSSTLQRCHRAPKTAVTTDTLSSSPSLVIGLPSCDVTHAWTNKYRRLLLEIGFNVLDFDDNGCNILDNDVNISTFGSPS